MWIYQDIEENKLDYALIDRALGADLDRVTQVPEPGEIP